MLVRPSAFNGIAKRTDYESCMSAVRDARRLLSEYINPCSPSDSVETLDHIIDILDNDTVEAVLKRIDGRDHFGLLEIENGSPDREPLDDAG
jgi:hypothetical protein